jgi:hypothetical protein
MILGGGGAEVFGVVPALRNRNRNRNRMNGLFDHEKLEVYQAALSFIEWLEQLIREKLRCAREDRGPFWIERSF